MARALRIEYPGAVYRVMARGNQGQAVFQDDADRKCFLTTLGAARDKTGRRIHAYVLMGNHSPLLVETPEANLVVGMKWLQSTYTQRLGLSTLGLSAEGLGRLSKGAVEKVALAWRLRRWATVSLRVRSAE